MEKMLYDWTSGIDALMKAVANVPSFIRSNFLLTGNSTEILRRVAIDVSRTIQDENQIPFAGVMKSFALRVPVTSSYEGASNILEALMSSVEHAAGYYSVYKGIVILELDQDWMQVKDLSALREYMNYVQANRDYICFIFLVPSVDATHIEECILQYGVFHHIEVPEPSKDQLATMFKLNAREKGYRLSPDAEKRLPEKAELVLAAGGNYPLLVEHLVEKAAYFHVVDGYSDKTLRARDIDRLTMPGRAKAEESAKRRIGFARGD